MSSRTASCEERLAGGRKQDDGLVRGQVVVAFPAKRTWNAGKERALPPPSGYLAGPAFGAHVSTPSDAVVDLDLSSRWQNAGV